MSDIPSKEAMLRIAEDYERHAKRAEERARRSSRSASATTFRPGFSGVEPLELPASDILRWRLFWTSRADGVSWLWKRMLWVMAASI